MEKGTKNGTITDFDGNFSLRVSNKSGKLIFSAVGFKTTEVEINEKLSLTVLLSESVENLKEIIFCHRIKKALLNLINSAELK